MPAPMASTTGGAPPLTATSQEPGAPHLPSPTITKVFADATHTAHIHWVREPGLDIHIPPENCTPAAMRRLCNEVCDVIHRGRSLAVAAGEQIDSSKVLDPAAAAKSRFTHIERCMYRDWERGIELEPWDFQSHTAADITGSKLKHFTTMAKALRIIYGVDDVSPSQAREWVIANQGLVPLCKAQAKILKAERDAAGRMKGMDPKMLLEKRTLRRIQALIGRRRNAWGQWWAAFNRRLDEAERALQMRISQLQPAGTALKHMPMPANQAVHSTCPSARIPRAVKLAALARGKRAGPVRGPHPGGLVGEVPETEEAQTGPSGRRATKRARTTAPDTYAFAGKGHQQQL